MLGGFFGLIIGIIVMALLSPFAFLAYFAFILYAFFVALKFVYLNLKMKLSRCFGAVEEESEEEIRFKQEALQRINEKIQENRRLVS